MNRFIRKTSNSDLPAVMDIYAEARGFMRKSGNINQWINGYPLQSTVENDIRAGVSYVCMGGDEILAVFYYNIERDPTYAKIDGAWLNDEPYGVVHRIARARNAGGVGAFCLDWCFEQIPNIRIDTHKDNAPMLRLLEKLGFVYCGIIWVENGDERRAFQKNAVTAQNR